MTDPQPPPVKTTKDLPLSQYQQGQLAHLRSLLGLVGTSGLEPAAARVIANRNDNVNKNVINGSMTYCQAKALIEEQVNFMREAEIDQNLVLDERRYGLDAATATREGGAATEGSLVAQADTAAHHPSGSTLEELLLRVDQMKKQKKSCNSIPLEAGGTDGFCCNSSNDESSFKGSQALATAAEIEKK